MQVLVRHQNATSSVALRLEASDTAADVARKYADAAGVPRECVEQNTRVVYRGLSLPPNVPLLSAGVRPSAMLELLPRLLGGGGDGGSTGAESRSAYLAMYLGKKPDKVNPEEERLARWTNCHLSGMPLRPPCVADALGNLYNKEALVQALLNKAMPRSVAHITTLKHVYDVTLTEVKGAAADAAVRFACPVTGAPMNGKGKFVIVRRGKGPGVVVSERALKELAAVAKELVGGEWKKEDLTPVYPQGEERDALRAAVAAQLEAELAAKRAKKAAKAAAKGEKGGGKRELAAVAVADGEADVEEAAKKARAVPAPAHADPAVWSSLFTSSGKKENNNDYMVRGQLKYAA